MGISSGREIWTFGLGTGFDMKKLAQVISAAKTLGLVPVIEARGAFKCQDGEIAFLKGNEDVQLRGGKLYWIDAACTEVVTPCADGHDAAQVIVSCRRAS